MHALFSVGWWWKKGRRVVFSISKNLSQNMLLKESAILWYPKKKDICDMLYFEPFCLMESDNPLRTPPTACVCLFFHKLCNLF